jgi:hypothetical protein
MPAAKYSMSSRAVLDIQKSLDAIRAGLDDANLQTRLEALQLMLATSDSVVALARKLADPKRPQPKKLKVRAARQVPPRTSTKAPPISSRKSSDRVGDFEPQEPVPPLGSQRLPAATVKNDS